MKTATKIDSFTIDTFSRRLKNSSTRKGIYITIKDSDKRESKGEISPLPGRSLETFDQAHENIKKLQQNFFSFEKKIFTLHPSVMFGMQMALFCLKNPIKEPKVPITTLLASPPISIPKGPVKLKFGDLTIQEAINFYKKTISNEKNIRIDLERKWPLEKTCDFCSQIDTSKIVYIEDPVTYYCNLEVFFQKTKVPFALDNFLFFQPPEKIKKLQGLHSIIVKPSLIGGINECQNLKTLFDPIPIVISSLFETEVGIYHLKILWSILCGKNPAGIDTLKFFVK